MDRNFFLCNKKTSQQEDVRLHHWLMHFGLILIGSGPAGEKGAAQAAYFGKKVALIEREPFPGGASANTGTLPLKTLRETAHPIHSLRQRFSLPGGRIQTALLTTLGTMPAFLTPIRFFISGSFLTASSSLVAE
jgi:hypothetical protein